jgi:hypothetical protein
MDLSLEQGGRRIWFLDCCHHRIIQQSGCLSGPFDLIPSTPAPSGTGDLSSRRDFSKNFLSRNRHPASRIGKKLVDFIFEDVRIEIMARRQEMILINTEPLNR